jgi:hypothetical protein
MGSGIDALLGLDVLVLLGNSNAAPTSPAWLAALRLGSFHVRTAGGGGDR